MVWYDPKVDLTKADDYGSEQQRNYARKMAELLGKPDTTRIRSWTQGVARVLEALNARKYAQLAGMNDTVAERGAYGLRGGSPEGPPIDRTEGDFPDVPIPRRVSPPDTIEKTDYKPTIGPDTFGDLGKSMVAPGTSPTEAEPDTPPITRLPNEFPPLKGAPTGLPNSDPRVLKTPSPIPGNPTAPNGGPGITPLPGEFEPLGGPLKGLPRPNKLGAGDVPPSPDPLASPMATASGSSDMTGIQGNQVFEPPEDWSKKTGFGNRWGTMQKVGGLAIHHTGDRHSNEQGIEDAKSSGYTAQYRMGRDGKVIRYVPEGAVAQHIRNGEGQGKGRSNRNMEGIEVVGHSDADWTPEQRQALKAFAGWHANKYGYDPRKNILGHSELNPGHRSNEGAGFSRAVRSGKLVLPGHEETKAPGEDVNPNIMANLAARGDPTMEDLKNRYGAPGNQAMMRAGGPETPLTEPDINARTPAGRIPLPAADEAEELKRAGIAGGDKYAQAGPTNGVNSQEPVIAKGGFINIPGYGSLPVPPARVVMTPERAFYMSRTLPPEQKGKFMEEYQKSLQPYDEEFHGGRLRYTPDPHGGQTHVMFLPGNKSEQITAGNVTLQAGPRQDEKGNYYTAIPNLGVSGSTINQYAAPGTATRPVPGQGGSLTPVLDLVNQVNENTRQKVSGDTALKQDDEIRAGAIEAGAKAAETGQSIDNVRSLLDETNNWVPNGPTAALSQRVRGIIMNFLPGIDIKGTTQGQVKEMLFNKLRADTDAALNAHGSGITSANLSKYIPNEVNTVGSNKYMTMLLKSHNDQIKGLGDVMNNVPPGSRQAYKVMTNYLKDHPLMVPSSEYKGSNIHLRTFSASDKKEDMERIVPKGDLYLWHKPDARGVYLRRRPVD